MTISWVKMTMFKSMHEIGDNTKSSMLIDFLGRIHKLAKETHYISDAKMYNGQVDKLSHKSKICMNIYK